MEISLMSVLALGFVLGIKHAIEPDHVIAVSTIASQSRSLWKSSMAGVFWGIGHTATLFIVGLALILMKSELTEKWSMSLEFLVGVMLVYLGITSLISFKKVHVHKHEHEGVIHKHFHMHNYERDQRQIREHKHEHKGLSYVKSMLVGLVHGLAGSAAMVMLTMTTVHNAWEGAAYILTFGVGTVVGMFLFTTIIGIPFVLSAKRTGINRALTRMAGAISTAFGVYYMYNLGVTEGLFKLWMQG